MNQLVLFEEPAAKPASLDLNNYDKYIVYFSGGKDSLACLLHLLERGVDKSKIELWHQLIDGDDDQFMDWPCTPAYCTAVAEALGVPIYYQWRVGGFRREMLKENERLAPVQFQMENGEIYQTGGARAKIATRRKFPAPVASLITRWCSGSLKIDVATADLTNDMRFRGIRTLTLSGERAQESKKRESYLELEPDRADLRNGKDYQRHIDRWRPVHKWTETKVWGIIERWSINPHPAYHLGWGRCSCLHCIFGNPNQAASAQAVDAGGFKEIVDYEIDFDYTIHNGESYDERADRGTPYEMKQEGIDIAISEEYSQPVIVDEWLLPTGAYGESCGPS